MNVVIPMSGEGTRFKSAGWKALKPLIEVEGRAIIAHVVEKFPETCRFTFVCNRVHLETTRLADTLRGICPKGAIVAVEPHKLGPVHAVRQAYHLIGDEEPVIVNYCDFGWEWDFEAFRSEVLSEGVDGCIPAYRGFHPHSLGPNLYAYMRTEGNRVLEIREKHHFTPNKMDEYASSGTYYFRTGAVLKRYFDLAVERNLSVGGEFYVSSVYQPMILDGLDVTVYPLKRFLQWGTPEDLENYLKWSDAFRDKAAPVEELKKKPVPMAGVVLMAGEGRRFIEAGFRTPKPFIPISGRPMVEQAVRSLPPCLRTIVVAREDQIGGNRDRISLLQSDCPGVEIVSVPGLTKGQAVTAMVGVQALPPGMPVLVASCDTGLAFDRDRFQALAADPSVDAVIFTFKGHLPAIWRPASYGWVDTEGTRAVKVAVKTQPRTRLRDACGVVGAFFFRSAGGYLEAARELLRTGRSVNGEYYIDELMNIMIEQGKNVRVLDVDHYLVWGTPDEVRTYRYWQQHFHNDPRHPYNMAADTDFPDQVREGGF